MQGKLILKVLEGKTPGGCSVPVPRGLHSPALSITRWVTSSGAGGLSQGTALLGLTEDTQTFVGLFEFGPFQYVCFS